MSNSLYPTSMPINPDWEVDSKVVQAGRPEKIGGSPMNPPIVLSSTYVHDTDLAYGRDGNNTWGALENALGTLDQGLATIFSSGLAAAAAIADLVPTGGKVVLPNAAYYGVKNLFMRLEAHERVEIVLVDMSNTSEVIAATNGAAMVWMESIANPLMVVADIPTIAKAAKSNNAIVVVDATFATPLRQNPLQLGADIVLHSGTKMIGGHSDLLMGIAIAKSSEHSVYLSTHRHDHGATPGSLETFLTLRGLRTLSVRLEKAEANALEIAKRLSNHPRVTKVNYPALETDSQHKIAKQVLPKGVGNMLSFELEADEIQTDKILNSLKLLTHATSLGGVESAIERRTRWGAEAAAGVPMSLCRFSVGIENVEDIWRDLNHAINGVL